MVEALEISCELGNKIVHRLLANTSLATHAPFICLCFFELLIAWLSLIMGLYPSRVVAANPLWRCFRFQPKMAVLVWPGLGLLQFNKG